MRRRLAAGFLALCLVLSLAAFPAKAAEIILVAINDTIPSALNEAGMPFYLDGTVYLPYTTFQNPVLGVVPFYDTIERRLTLSDGQRNLTYDLTEGSVTADGIQDQSRTSMLRYGIPFIPADDTCAFFGIALSYLSSADGYPVVRMKTGAEVYNDSVFMEEAESLIDYRVEQFLPTGNVQDQEPPPVIDPVDQPGEEDQTEDPLELPEQPYQAVAFLSLGETLLTELERQGQEATFLLTLEELQSAPKLVRRALGIGCHLGVDVRDAESPLEAVQAFNQTLDDLVCQKTLLVLAGGDFPEPENYFVFTAREDDALLLLDGLSGLQQLRALQAESIVPIPALRESTVLTEPVQPEAGELTP